MWYQVSINVGDILAWAPIIISLIALYYSRKAFRVQVTVKRREHVAVVNIRHLDLSDVSLYPRHRRADTPGVVISNPMSAPLDAARIVYHDRRFGSIESEIALRGIREHTQLYPQIATQIGEILEVNRQRHRELVRRRAVYASISGTTTRLRARVCDVATDIRVSIGARRIRRLLQFYLIRSKPGRIAVAETFIVDASGEEWYVNTDKKKYHISRYSVPRALFFTAYRLRLIGYTFYARHTWPAWLGAAAWAGNITLVLDHYLNSGGILIELLTMLGRL